MRRNRLGCCACVLAFALVSCNGTALHVSMPENANASGSPTNTPTKQSSDETVYSLDLEKPEIEQEIKAGDVGGARFVQVQVAEVTNPQNHPVRFEVRYQPKEGETIFLGSFSLFPSNNPGKFIVPTHGKVKDEGKIILTLAKSDQVAPGDVLRAKVKRIKFVNEQRS